MCAGCRATGPACSACSPMPACRSWWMARRTTRSAPAELATWMERFVVEDGLNLIGGCCGTSIAAHRGAGCDAAPPGRRALPPGAGDAHGRCGCPRSRRSTPRRRCGRRTATSPSASAATPTAPRRGASGRRRSDWDGCVAMGREQVAEGSNSLDICTAFVGRDEMAEMNEVIRRFTGSVNAPLVIDSTETPVIEAALKLHGGKPIINSINFEDGEGARARPADARQEVRRRRHRADHRRGRHGEDRRGQARASPAGWWSSPATSTACRNPTC